MATFVKDPITGAMTLAPGSTQGPVADPSSRSVTDLNGGTPSGGTPAAPTSSTDKFNLALMGILRQAQSSGSTAPLYASEDELQNEKLNLSNPLASTPYAPIFQGMGYAAPAAEEQTQEAFNPGITSVESQIQAENDAETKFNDMANTAETIAQNNKNVVAPGQSIVDNNGNVIFQGHSYTPTANPATGMIDGFDETTGTWLSEDQSKAKAGTSAPAPGSNVIIGGVDLSGASTGVQPYAKDPNYSTEVNGVYQNLQKGMPVPNAEALDTYIQGHAKGSTVTGSMIMNAATTYGIDPTLLASVLAQESDFGTAGLGAKTMNPGNVGNNDQGVQTTYASMQKGVNAAAMELAKRMPGNPSAGKPSGSLAGSTSAVGGQFSPLATTQVAKIPAALQSYVQAGPAGVAYIDDSRVPESFKTTVQALSSQAGIPYLDAGDVGSMQSIIQAQQNLNLMESTAKNVLGSGVGGYLKDAGATLANKLTGGNAFPDFNQFNSYATEAINLIKGLAGGTGSGLRMTQSEIDTAQSNIPTSSDTIANAMKKVQVLQGLVYTRLSSVFPSAQVVMVNPTTGQSGYVPASQYSDAISEGYTTPTK